MTLIDPRERIHNPESDLSGEFRLDLQGHELIDPDTNRGHVVSIEHIETLSDAQDNKVCDIYEIEVEDPFVHADPIANKIVKEYIAGMEFRLLQDGINPLIGERQEATSRSERNRYTHAWTGSPDAQGVDAWREAVPSARALDPLTKPYAGHAIIANDGSRGVVDVITAAQLRHTSDGVGIRDRAVASEYLIGKELAIKNRARMLSLASGTAEPAIAAAKGAQLKAEAAGNQLEIDMTVADYDVQSLKLVAGNAELYDFDGNVSTVLQNILTHKLRTELAKATGNNAPYDVVEILGFEEYLPQEGDELTAKKGQGLPQASEFTKRAFDLVAEGGVLISGNMVLDRPEINFVFGIVDWPLINARSEESILRVYKEAGILDDPNAKVEMYRIRNADNGDHVYNIVKVTKLPA